MEAKSEHESFADSERKRMTNLKNSFDQIISGGTESKIDKLDAEAMETISAERILKDLIFDGDPEEMRENLRELTDHFLMHRSRHCTKDYVSKLYYTSKILDDFLLNLARYNEVVNPFPGNH